VCGAITTFINFTADFHLQQGIGQLLLEPGIFSLQFSQAFGILDIYIY
jgi:hypothetical protein